MPPKRSSKKPKNWFKLFQRLQGECRRPAFCGVAQPRKKKSPIPVLGSFSFLLIPVFVLISGGVLFAFLNQDLFLPREKTKERKAMAVLKADHFYLLDEEAYILGVAEDNGGLPILNTGWSSLGLKEGDFFPQEEIKKALVIIRELGLLELKVKEAIWQDQDLEVVLLGTPTRTFFSLEKDLIFQVNSLQVILKRAKIEGKVFEKIDLRFGKPVITL